jgi:cell wall-associated NlpC family hydrolase
MRQTTHALVLRLSAAFAAAGATTLAASAYLAPAADSSATEGQSPRVASLFAVHRVLDDSVFGRAVGRAHNRTRRRLDRATVAVKQMIAAGNRIATVPYTYGGGHGTFDSSGYDCSGSVSYVLHAAGLLSTPLDSVGLEGFGAPGPGKHVTIYANDTHAWMTVDGRRFDTIALQETGTRWSSTIGSVDGYIVRHPVGL